MRLSPLLILVIIAIAGCVGQQATKSSANDGIVIERFAVDPRDVFDFQTATFTLDVTNTGGTTARNVEAKLLNVEGIWRRQDGSNPADSNDVQLGRDFSMSPGDSRFFARALIAPNLREGDRAAFPVKARATFDYTTTGSIRMKAVSFERMQLLQGKGQSVSDPFSESNSDSPVKMSFARGAVPVIINSREEGSAVARDFRFEIQNVGSGFPITDNNVGQIGGSSRANAIRLRAPNGIRLERCEGIRGAGSTDRFSIDLRSDGTAPISCTVSFDTGLFRTPSDEVSLVFDFELNYRYFVEDEVSVNVQGTKREDAPPGGIASTSSTTTTIISGPGTLALLSSLPTAGATNVPLSSRTIQMTFNRQLNINSISNAVAVAGSIEGQRTGTPSLSNDGQSLIFTLANDLQPSSTYTVTILQTLRGSDGSTLPSQLTFSFSTIITDTTPPTLTLVAPALDAFVTTGTPTISMRTNEKSTCTIKTGPVAVGQTLSTDNNGLDHSLVLPLSDGLKTFTISCRDTAGNVNPAASDLTIRFTVDATAPTITSTDPANAAAGVSRTKQISITFSEPMDTTSAENAFTISPSVNGQKTWNAQQTQMFFTPSAQMAATTEHTVTIAATAKDKAGNALTPLTFKFTTGA